MIIKGKNPLKTLLSKAFLTGLAVAMIGIITSVTPMGRNWEQEVGLSGLFTVRGVRPVPDEVVVITTDRKSAFDLGVPQETWKWPRSLHGQLVRELTHQGATAIAFDLFFKESVLDQDDAAFAEAIRDSGKVVLIEKMTTPGQKDAIPGMIMRVRPTAQLAQAASALAPNPLPAVPFRVNQFWLFEPSPDHLATMPVITALIHNLTKNPEFMSRVETINQTLDQNSQESTPSHLSLRDPQAVAEHLRNMVRANPQGSEYFFEQGEQGMNANPQQPPQHEATFRNLLRAIQRGDSQYLDYYGPPRTISTIPYSCALKTCSSKENPSGTSSVNFEGKAVFVGLSEEVEAEQKDRFHTVFTSKEGLYLSGVEIAATAFANLIENRHVSALHGWNHLALIAGWGFLLGLAFCFFPQPHVLRSGTGLALAYLGNGVISGGAYASIAYTLFVQEALWLPLVTPLLIQLPLALLGTVFWRYREAYRERQNIQQALQYYVPAPVAHQLSKSIEEISTTSQLVEGVCLSTDAEHYTTLAESLDLKELRAVMNRYFEIVFEPVRRQQGIVSDVVGDAVLAIWATPTLTQETKQQVCAAALDIMAGVEQFNFRHPDTQLPTRIGIHGGPLLLGNVGAIDHYEYRAVGDIVNTATRIEGVNKYLGTRILGSHIILGGVPGFLTRELGRFRLVGKKKPILLYELICREEEAEDTEKDALKTFAFGLDAFRAQRWDEANTAFRTYLSSFGDDGPCQYYLEAIDRLKVEPPLPSWEGTVTLKQK